MDCQKQLIKKHQSTQNTAVRLITDTYKYDHVMPPGISLVTSRTANYIHNPMTDIS